MGYIQRGGTPSPMDRVLATRYGSAAADLIAGRDFGKMVALKNTEIVSVPLSDVTGKLKLVDQKDTAGDPGSEDGYLFRNLNSKVFIRQFN